MLGLPGWNSSVTQGNLTSGDWSTWDTEVEEELCALSLAWGLSLGCCAANAALLGRSWGLELGGLRSLGVPALTQG